MRTLCKIATVSALMLGLLVTPELLVSPAQATIVVKLDFEKTVELSDKVVRGTVVSKEGKMVGVGEGRQTPMTLYKVKVSHTYMGETSESFVNITNPGGVEVDGMKYHIPSGFPDHQVGEDLILMLEKGGPDRFAVTGLHQGRFVVMESSETGKVYVGRTNSSAQLIDTKTNQPVNSLSQQQIFDFDEFEEKLEEAVLKAGKKFNKPEAVADKAEKAEDSEK